MKRVYFFALQKHLEKDTKYSYEKVSKEAVTVHKRGFDAFPVLQERLFSFTPCVYTG